MRERIVSIAFALLLLVAGCSSSDPTTSAEYAALEKELAQAEARLELAQVEAQLVQVIAERDALAAANTVLSEQLARVPVGQAVAMDQPTSSPTTGQTVSVTVEGLVGLAGHELAGVLYEGEDLSLSVSPGTQTAESRREAVGGFQAIIAGDDFTTTQLVHQPDDGQMGPFPYVTDDVLTVEPGVYTLVLWEDFGLGPVNRWVPVNTDGHGLNGCQHVFEVGGDAQTDVVVEGDLSPNGWDVACTTL
ncbi:MAG: hypothetical protein U9R51_09495 [Actinomycetota bacterium]|nr:hypothetical protein [Actinomycetota bacterium]